MVKNHTIKLTISNETNYVMTFVTEWFDSGRLADNFQWPEVIRSKETITVVLYERDWSIAGCSGYVQYLMGGKPVTIAFSNPSVGMNKVGVGPGTDGYVVWDGISSHNYEQFADTLWIGGTEVLAICECTEGSTNDATVRLHVQDPTPMPTPQLPPPCIPSGQYPPTCVPSGQLPPPCVPPGSLYPNIDMDNVYPPEYN